MPRTQGELSEDRSVQKAEWLSLRVVWFQRALSPKTSLGFSNASLGGREAKAIAIQGLLRQHRRRAAGLFRWTVAWLFS